MHFARFYGSVCRCSKILQSQHILRHSSRLSKLSETLSKGPELKDFIKGPSEEPILPETVVPPYLEPSFFDGKNKKVFLDVYGCQMNVNDTEIVWSILQSSGYLKTSSAKDADVILLMTCAIRDSAEQKIWNVLSNYKSIRKKKNVQIGVLGCMAERLKSRMLEEERAIDLVAGPDSYRDLPRLLSVTASGQQAANVLLSWDETYADIVPVRINDSNSVTAFVSIMRGCDNMCSYCIVPFTRGRERSRPISSIIDEVKLLSSQGVKEVTLLGQNVNSYRDTSCGVNEETHLVPGFKTVYKTKQGGLRFASLLQQVATVDPQMRIRFTSPHPKDFPTEVLDVMKDHPNICKSLHVPAQSGSDFILDRMRRGYTASAYMDLIAKIRDCLPGVSLSSDFIAGFCGESEEDFEKTLDLMRHVGYNVAYLFAYSMREKTTAHRRYNDDVPQKVKLERVARMSSVFRQMAADLNEKLVGTTQTILIEGRSRRSLHDLQGRTDGNIKVIIPKSKIPQSFSSQTKEELKPGHYVSVKITDSNSQVLKGIPLHLTSLPV